MAEAQRSFPINTDSRIRDRIANWPLPIRLRYQGLTEDGDEIEAKRQFRMSQAAALKDDMDALAMQIHQAKKEVKKSGADYYSETNNVDANGKQSTSRQTTNYISELEAEYEAKKTQRRALLEVKSPRNWPSILNDALSGATIHLVPFGGDPLTWAPREGEQFTEGYTRELGPLNILRDRLKTTWDANLTKAEALVSVDAEVEDLASKAPSIGGHTRGSSYGDRGVLRIGNPGKRIGFLETRIGPETVTVDAVRLVAWAFKDQLKKVCREHINATYSDDGAISAADKAVLIPKIEAELWQQRRVVEAAYLACRAAGIRNLNRPKDTPVEILLDVIPFSKAKLFHLQAVSARVDEPAAPDFEDDGTDK